MYLVCNGCSAITNCIVEQLGFAIIRSFFVNDFAFISGTISFLLGSILQAEELSITTLPAEANLGAQAKDISPPAEKSAISGFKLRALCKSITLCSSPLKIIFLPILFSEAAKINLDTGKFLCSIMDKRTEPTKPVAPTIATFI